MARTPAIVAVVLMAAAQLASAGFPNQYWPAPSTPAPSVPSTGFPTYGWENAHATFYGSDSGLGGDFGGACGYSGSDIASLYSTRTAAMSTPLFEDGNGCGRCYEIRCVQSRFCLPGSPSVIITGTNLCPPNWYQDSNAGGWCNPPRRHFDMAPPSFYKLAQRVAGIVPVKFRRVPCERRGGVQFCLMGNPYWLLLHVNNVGGGGDVAEMAVREKGGQWVQMTQNWGITYQAFAALPKELGLEVRITGGTDRKTIIVGDAIPAWWGPGLCYQGSNNFW